MKAEQTELHSDESIDQWPAKSILKDWFNRGMKCRFVNFYKAVPHTENTEPSTEFRVPSKFDDNGNPMRLDKRTKRWVSTSATDKKYYVKSMSYTPYGLIWESNGEMYIAPLANVAWARPLTDEQ